MIATRPAEIPRTIFSDEHAILRDSARRFCEREIVPFHAQWELDGRVSRDVWRKAGAAGLLCMSLPEEYGGADADFRSSAVLIEELAKVNASGPGFALQSDIVAPYILHYGSDAQKQKWLPRLASGETISAIAMTEPGTGSDLQSITTRAEPEGDGFAITGAKTFVTNGVLADLIIVVAKTDPSAGARGVSLFLVERNTPGFSGANALKKLGLHAQDTAEFTMDRVHVPASSMLGAPGMGFKMLMSELPQERMIIAVSAVASAEAGLNATIAYTSDREAFGKRILDFQNTRFTLATLKAQIAMARTFVDRCVELLCEGRLDAATAAMAKYETSELQFRALDACLQLHGGYGYMKEYPIAKAWADARVQRIYGGSNEIMLEIIGRTLESI
ncbi:MAG: acyl-CoA dehydrogenase family protein [Candidatus Eremiobacteraeota bacterium]|nr:acyl-CoA dehydrogenase family protein [Candidatus Eremiobacteraeota bacterium]